MTDDEILKNIYAMCGKCPNNPAPAGLNPGCNGGCESTIGWEAMLEENEQVRLLGRLGDVLKQVAEKKSRGQLNSHEFIDVEGLLEDVASWCQGHLDGEGWDEIKAIFDKYRTVPRPDYTIQLPVSRPIAANCATCTLEDCSNYHCVKSVYCQFYQGHPIIDTTKTTGVHEQKFKAGL